MSSRKENHEGKTSAAKDPEMQVLKPNDADAALEFMTHENTGTMTEVDEKKLVRKIDWRIVPLMCEYLAGLPAIEPAKPSADAHQGLATTYSTWTRR